ncbi:involucrin-like [Helianthus annuus]|uniref:involucrin-like n=1 Tax=Helianthus annuus TaxID=4232 RepID=UPI000B8FE112|nr:involucrin-like [Helianthus annuus]
MVIGGLPVLTKWNYKVWSVKMEGLLKDYGFWDIIEPPVDVVVNERKMYTALGYVCQTLPDDILEKAAQEAAEKERLNEIVEKERLNAIVQEEQARKKEAQEAAEKEEALQAVLEKPYVKVNNRASVEEKLEPKEKFRSIVREKSPRGLDKGRKTNPIVSFGLKSNFQECLDKQRKKRKVRKNNLSIEQVMQQICEYRKVQEKKVFNEVGSEMNVEGLNDEYEEPVKQEIDDDDDDNNNERI